MCVSGTADVHGKGNLPFPNVQSLYTADDPCQTRQTGEFDTPCGCILAALEITSSGSACFAAKQGIVKCKSRVSPLING
jgi:hypothetical protein